MRNFTRKDAIKSVGDLTQVTTDVGRGVCVCVCVCVCVGIWMGAMEGNHMYCDVTLSCMLGRAWLFMALNEQVIGSYLRLFLENQPTVGDYYYR